VTDTPTPLTALLAEVGSLDSDKGITFEARADKIVGRWEAESYKVTAVLDPEAALYDLEEKKRGDKGGRVRKQLVTFLAGHGWQERPQLGPPAQSRLIIR
jgi:hypothetical protein